MIGLQDRHALTLAGQHRQSDMVGGQKEGRRWRVTRQKKSICQCLAQAWISQKHSLNKKVGYKQELKYVQSYLPFLLKYMALINY